MKLSVPRLLDPSATFLDHYLHYCGDTQVPHQFNSWCGIALIAAAVADRVWYEKFKGKKLAPNLYVALVGPGACGKGEAIDNVLRLATAHPTINVYNGRSTPQFLTEYMSKARAEDGSLVSPKAPIAVHQNNKIFVAHEELGESIDKGESADRLVKFFTKNYSVRPYLVHDGTIMRGLKAVESPCINWLFGSNMTWLMDVFPESSIAGGTWGRIIGVQGAYNFKHRVRKPLYPTDWEDTKRRLHERLDELTQLDGEFTMTDTADKIADVWFYNRDEPVDDSLAPAWIRQDDLVLKLAMILSLSESCDLRIRKRHMEAAQKLSDDVLSKLADIQATAMTTQDTRGIMFLRQRLRHATAPILHSELVKEFYRRGFGGSDLFRPAIQTLIEGREASATGNGRGIVYAWTARRRMPKGVEAAGNGHPDD